MTARPSPQPPASSPSPAWFGATLTVSLFLSIAWLLSYTLLDLGWQQNLGAWNYLIALLMSNVFSQMLRRWHGHPRAR